MYKPNFTAAKAALLSASTLCFVATSCGKPEGQKSEAETGKKTEEEKKENDPSVSGSKANLKDKNEKLEVIKSDFETLAKLTNGDILNKALDALNNKIDEMVNANPSQAAAYNVVKFAITTLQPLLASNADVKKYLDEKCVDTLGLTKGAAELVKLTDKPKPATP